MFNSLTVAVLVRDPKCLKFYSETLSTLGVEVISTSSDLEYSLDVVLEKMPDIFIMDVFIPEMNVLEFIDVVRQSSPNTLILFCNALFNTYLENVCTNRDSVKYIGKSSNAEILIDFIMNFKSHFDKLICLKVKVSEDTVRNALSEFEFPDNIKGSLYIISAVCMMVNLGVPLENIHVTKEIYPKIAKLYETTEANAERGIRYCIYSMMDRMKSGIKYDFLRELDDNGNYKYSNSKFLLLMSRVVVDKLNNLK